MADDLKSEVLEEVRCLTFTGYVISDDKTSITLAFCDTHQVGSKKIIVNLSSPKQISIEEIRLLAVPK
ncbi:MAG: hypothetical protein PHF86_14255 [Candidatus Nanoarchaeia archaeon]|jgi:hypothetical protein|nr:hypothetical protein [Candidatus Nanoarchaeia archaeon]